MAASWGVLGGSWGILGTHGSTFVVLSSTGRVMSAQLAPKRDPTWDQKGTPKRTKIEDKNDDEKRSSRRSSWNGLGAILGRSWVVLGPALGSKTCCGPSGVHFFEKSNFGKNAASRRDLGACWADLGAQRALKRSPRRSQDGAKKEKKK